MKKLRQDSVKINVQDLSDWLKKHDKHANDDIVCDLLRILDTSELTSDNFSTATMFKQDISKWNTD